MNAPSPRSAVLPPAFEVSRRSGRGHVAVAVAGEIDVATVHTVRRELDGVAWSGFDDVVLDLSDATFIDSCGIVLIIRRARMAARRGHRFRVRAGGPPISRVLRLSGVHDVVEVLDQAPG